MVFERPRLVVLFHPWVPSQSLKCEEWTLEIIEDFLFHEIFCICIA